MTSVDSEPKASWLYPKACLVCWGLIGLAAVRPHPDPEPVLCERHYAAWLAEVRG